MLGSLRALPRRAFLASIRLFCRFRKKKMKNKNVTSSAIRLTKSGSKLPAHSTTLYESVSQLDRAVSAVYEQLELVKRLDIDVWVISRLQFLFGLRISEALSILGSDIDRYGRIVVQGQKGSSSRLVVDTELIKFWLSRRLLLSQPVFTVNRFYVYRVYCKVGLKSEIEGSKYNAVTHYPRHLFVKQMQKSTNDIEETRLLVGHKKSSNTKRYLKSKTK